MAVQETSSQFQILKSLIPPKFYGAQVLGGGVGGVGVGWTNTSTTDEYLVIDSGREKYFKKNLKNLKDTKKHFESPEKKMILMEKLKAKKSEKILKKKGQKSIKGTNGGKHGTINKGTKDGVSTGGVANGGVATLAFSKLDFDSVPSATSLTTALSKKSIDTASLLKIAEKKEKKLKEIVESDPSKAKEIQDAKQWRDATLQAQGIQPKTDVKLLKKTLKRKAGEKDKSRQEWKEREREKESIMKKRQDKRQENILAKKSGGASLGKKVGKKSGGAPPKHKSAKPGSNDRKSIKAGGGGGKSSHSKSKGKKPGF